eukprot:TRINITY_DN3075_c0_g1_i1.p1 TRINITY_DN3075_c0_g1~~TRINITY_DN3075_c0_g1_i1.p1  ORF type:complete len:310 (+),score=113.75 TRINITY_DN3075_c0_g1_i1:93-1022(+)
MATSADLSAMLEQVCASVQEHMLFQAHDQLLKLDAVLEENSESAEVAAFKDTVMKEQEDLITQLRFDVKDCTSLLEDLMSDEDWELGVEKATIKTFMKSHPDLDHTLITVKGRCEVEAPVQNVVMLMNEIDLYHKWVPLVKSGENMLEMNPFDKMMHVFFNFPMPINFVMSARDVVFHGYVVKKDEDGKPAWVVNVRDARPEEEERMKRDYNFEIEEQSKGYVRCQLVNGGMHLVPHGRNKCTVECELSVNPQLNLPTSIVGLLCRKFAYMFFEMLSKRSVKLGKEYNDRVDKELYATIRDDLEKAFPE